MGQTQATPAAATADARPEAYAKDVDYTMSEVQKHKKRGDCWIVVDGVIYDASSYADSHPGGPHWINEVTR